MRKEITGIETILPVNEPGILWYSIPGFNGYEISNGCIVRSMKNYKKYPYGMLISPKGKAENPSFTLSNDNGERVTIKLSEIMKIVSETYNKIPGYPRHTWEYDISGRDKRYLIKGKKNENLITPKFTIIG